MCARDPVHWINTWAWTYDPRETCPNLPFDLFPLQVEFIRWLQAREAAAEDGLAEKSRDMGFTWLCASYALWAWLFRPGFAAGFGSRKQDLVDKIGDPDCIFEKIRMLFRRLPRWMLPAGFTETEHDNFCKLLNPANGATITGEAGDEIGRGGRKTIYFIDEAAYLERPQKVEAALSQTTRCRIWVSTPNGPGNPFAKKRHGGKIKVFTFHWKSDPRKNRYEVRDATGAVVATGRGEAPPTVPAGCRVVYPWYEAECERLGDPVVIAQELDIDYTASIEGICIPAKWVRAAVGYPLPRSGPRVAGFDVAEEGKNRSVMIPRQGPVAEMPVDWGQSNTTQTAYRARDEGEKLNVEVVFYDADGPGMGVKGTWQSAERPLPFRAVPVFGGDHPTETVWPDGRTSKERFRNLRAELWWLLRMRFERTYERVLWEQGDPAGKHHPDEECISLPDCPQLIAQLSQPLVFTTDTGKTQLEGKPQMAKRGVASPDFADALAYSFMPDDYVPLDDVDDYTGPTTFVPGGW